MIDPQHLIKLMYAKSAILPEPILAGHPHQPECGFLPVSVKTMEQREFPSFHLAFKNHPHGRYLIINLRTGDRSIQTMSEGDCRTANFSIKTADDVGAMWTQFDLREVLSRWNLLSRKHIWEYRELTEADKQTF